jgi:ATP-dependent protease ClpP protease subunit
MYAMVRSGHGQSPAAFGGYIYGVDLVKIVNTGTGCREGTEGIADRTRGGIMPENKVVIKFFAPVINETINTLLNTIDEKMQQGTREFIILISTPGGNVHFGLSAYNYLKGIRPR